MVIELLFGARYVPAAPTLQVLSLGFLFNSLFGFNYHTLLTIGKSKFLMYCSLLSAIMNIILNILLIPKLGVLGASIASATSFILIELLMTIQLNYITGIHPFTKSYSKILLISALSIAIGYYIKLNAQPSYLTAVFLLLGLSCVFVIITIVTKALDETDISLINSVESKIKKLYGPNK
jgi:O-antigen/teichoic acid export membrane protein